MLSIILGKILYLFGKPCFQCDICETYCKIKVSGSFFSCNQLPGIWIFKILDEIKWLSLLGSPLLWAYTKFRFKLCMSLGYICHIFKFQPVACNI
jgi:hypothetical protein